MRFFWSRVECEAAVGSNVRSVPIEAAKRVSGFQGFRVRFFSRVSGVRPSPVGVTG